MDSTSTVLNYGNNTTAATNGTIGDRRSSHHLLQEQLQHQQTQTHLRINGHSQRIQGCATISIKSNTNNNSSLSYKPPLSAISSSTCTFTPTTNGTGMNGVLHLVPGASTNQQPLFLLDEASQQKLLSLLAAGSGGCGHGDSGCHGDDGGVATCSLAADASVLVADGLNVQHQSSVADLQVSEAVLGTSESFAMCNFVREEQVVCDQVLTSDNKVDTTRDFATVRERFQNEESLNSDPLMFLASAAEEVQSMMKVGGVGANEEGHGGGGEVHVGLGQLQSIGTANEGGLPLKDAKKEIINAGQLHSSPPREDNPVIKAVLTSPIASNKTLTNGDFEDRTATAVDSETMLNLLSDAEHTCTSQPISEPNLSPNFGDTSHNLQQESTNLLPSLSSGVGKIPTSLNAEEQKEKFVHNDSEVPTQATEIISVLESGGGEGLDPGGDDLIEAQLVNEGLMSLLQKAVDVEGAESESFTPGEENLMEYCLKMVDQQGTCSSTCSPEEAQLGNLATVDEFQIQLGEATECVITKLPPSPTVVDGASKIKGHKENAESADLAEDQQVDESETRELEIPSAPFNDGIHNDDNHSFKAGAGLDDSAAISTVKRESGTDMPGNATPTSDDHPSDNTSTHNESTQSADLTAAHLHVPMSLEINKNGDSPSPSSSVSSDETDNTAGPCPFDLTSLTSDENASCFHGRQSAGPQTSPVATDHEEPPSPSPRHSEEDNGKEWCLQPEIRQNLISSACSTVSCNTTERSDRNTRACEEGTADTALQPRVIAPPQAQVSGSLSSESDPAPCLSQETAISTPSSPISGGANKDQNITEADFTRSPISTITSQTITDTPKLEETNASATARVNSHTATAELLGRGRTSQSEEEAPIRNEKAQSSINRLKEFADMPLWVEPVESTVPVLDADREAKAQQIPAEGCSKDCDKEDSQIESGDDKFQEHMLIASCGPESALSMVDSDKLASPVDTDRMVSPPTDMDERGSSVAMDLELKVGNGKHDDGTGEALSGQIGANDVIVKSAHIESVESSLRVRVPLIPELQLPFYSVKEQSRSDEVNDHTDSGHATESTVASLTQSTESSDLANSELERPLVPFKEHPPLSSSDHNRDSVDDRNGKTTTSTCVGTTSSILATCADLSTNAYTEFNSDHNDNNGVDVDLLHSDLATEIHDQVVENDEDCSSTTSGIITTSACFRKEWSDTNSDSQLSSSTGVLSRSGSYTLSDSFNSCDRFSLLSGGTRNSIHRSKSSPEGVSDAVCVSGEETAVQRPTSISSSSLFRRKKAWDPGFYAASKIIMTRSKFADLRRIGDDFTISQALSCPFHDISSSDSFGSGSPEEEEGEEEDELSASKTAGRHQLGRSLSVSSMESASSSVCSLQGDDSSGR